MSAVMVWEVVSIRTMPLTAVAALGGVAADDQAAL
jgi:hypothetical protein